MKLKMLHTSKGSPNGVTINTYHAGREYDMPESLAVAFVEQMHVAAYIKNIEIETPEQVEIETPEKPIKLEQTKKTIKKKRGQPRKAKE